MNKCYRMTGGLLSLKLRAATAGYILRQWSVDCSADHRLRDPEFRLWLKDHLPPIRMAVFDVDAITRTGLFNVYRPVMIIVFLEIHSLVGVFEKLRLVIAMLGIECDPDTRPDVQAVVAYGEGLI
jgi:hypothetical protein